MTKWATYDDSTWPVVHVSMKGTIKNDNDFLDFVNDWLGFYNRPGNFTFIFDTSDVGFVNIKYAFRMSKFIKELKEKISQQKCNTLSRSFIVHNSFYVKILLKLIFFMEDPVAPVYILPKDQEYKIYQKIAAFKENANSTKTERLVQSL